MVNSILYFGPHTRIREARILCRHRRHFRLFRQTARVAAEFLASLPPAGTPQQLLVVGLFGRLHEATQAGVRLAQSGSERDVAISIRTTFELFVRLRAACADSDFVTRHDDDVLVHQKKLANANLKNPHLDGPARARLAQRAKELDGEITRRNAKAIKVEQLAREVGLDGEYATVYRMTSPFAHGAGRVLADYAFYEKDGSFAGFEFGATDANTDLYVDTLTEYTLRAICEVAGLFPVEVHPRLEALNDRLASLSDDGSDGDGGTESIGNGS